MFVIKNKNVNNKKATLEIVRNLNALSKVNGKGRI